MSARRGTYHCKRVRVIERLELRDGPGCYYCRVVLKPHNYTLDHWIPRSKGGANTINNLRVACKPCNTAKGNEWPHDIADKIRHTWFIECKRCNDGNALEVDDICAICGQVGKLRWRPTKTRKVVVSNDVASMRELRSNRANSRTRTSRRHPGHTQATARNVQRQGTRGYRKAG